MDKELVSKVLLWLEEYQKSYKVFLKVIKSYFKLTDENASVVADLFRKFFCFNKIIRKFENGKYMKTKEIKNEIYRKNI